MLWQMLLILSTAAQTAVSTKESYDRIPNRQCAEQHSRRVLDAQKIISRMNIKCRGLVGEFLDGRTPTAFRNREERYPELKFTLRR